MKARTLPALLAPYNQTRIAEHVGVTRAAVNDWAHNRTSPGTENLPKLAEILRVDLGDLTRIVAEDSRRRTPASDSSRAVA
jgi:transcriptional regulator with XRE-family HTH domain